MDNGRTTLHTSQSSPRRRGVVSGYVFKLVRELTHLTQAALAEDLGVEVATVQGWESGRRPLGALRAGDLTRLRMRMSRLGTLPAVFDILYDAIEADLVITDAVHAGKQMIDPEYHPLAASVHRRMLTA